MHDLLPIQSFRFSELARFSSSLMSFVQTVCLLPGQSILLHLAAIVRLDP